MSDVFLTPTPPQAVPEIELRTVFLQAGQLYVAEEPSVITTILGSCVAVCLWDRQLRLGGMNHYMLPYQTTRASVASLRFGDFACEQLVARLTDLGARREHLRAAVFGGACVMETFRCDSDHIGSRNVELAEQVLSRQQLRIIHRDVGGRRGRKLIFDTNGGHMETRYL